MADDISRKIIIGVEADTDQLNQNVTQLNQTLDGLLQKQKQLTESGQSNGKAFEDLAKQVKSAQTAVENYNKSIESYVKAIKTSKSSISANKQALAALVQKYNSLSKATGENSTGIGKLNSQIATLSGTIANEEAQLKKSRQEFNLHKATVNALSSSFDQLKGVSGTFGPSLQDAAKGFESLKSGLSVVKTGFSSVGQAIKTTGFGLLVIILQSLVEYFTKTTEGSKMLKGAISAVGKVIEMIQSGLAALGGKLVNAIMHPIDSLSALGKAIKENVINRFKAFSVILDGIIHLDFKKVGDGVLQAFTGVTHATDKLSSAFKTIKGEIKSISKTVVEAYKDGAAGAGKAIEKHEKKVKKSVDRQIGYFKKLKEAISKTSEKEEQPERPEQIDAGATPGAAAESPEVVQEQEISKATITQTQDTSDKVVAIKKTMLQKIEDQAKQSANKMASDALSIVSNSIKQESAAKIAALEKDKAAELSNRSLTSAQKIAIEQKFKAKENQEKVKAFKANQKLQLAQAVINGAVAIQKTTSEWGMPLAIPFLVPVIAQTAAQIASIASQKAPAFARGGQFVSDGKGALLSGYSRTDNTNAYLRSGEAVVVSEAMRNPWARNLVSAVNVAYGGRDFSMANPGKGYAIGGIFTDGGSSNRYYNQPVNDQKDLANTLAYQMINNFPPVYVDVKDVNTQQNILAQTINRVNL